MDTKILTSLLQGVMDCGDMISLSYLVDCQNFGKFQKGRLRTLLKLQDYVNYLVITDTKTIPNVSDSFSRILTFPITKPATELEINTLVGNAIIAWENWCKDAITLYEGKEDKVHKYLLKLHQKDLKDATRWKEKFRVTTPLSTRERIQQKLNAVPKEV